MGAKNLDRIPVAAWRQRVETVADFMRDRIEVITHCPKCGLQMAVDLALIARVSGPSTSLWNRKPRCRKLGCDGRANVKAKLPGFGYYQELVAPFPESQAAAANPEPVSLGLLAGHHARIHFTCRNAACDYMAARHYGWTLQASEAAQRWGAATALDSLRRRAKCKLCGARWPKIAVQVSTPTPKMGV